jgi:hypothetical protein
MVSEIQKNLARFAELLNGQTQSIGLNLPADESASKPT